MIAFDTNALVRMLVEDDAAQARTIKNIVSYIEDHSDRIIVPSEVLIETVWVLESVYHCTRAEVCNFLETLVRTATFAFEDPVVIRTAVSQYNQGGDFADLVIVNKAKRLKAKQLISFDKKLQKIFPGYVVESVKIHES
jgi:predicted nucleic-acid-binding protein